MPEKGVASQLLAYNASMDDAKQNRRSAVRTLLLSVVLLLLCSYVGSYYVLSRRGMAEAEHFSMETFYYLPIEGESITIDDARRNRLLVKIFAPLNLIDHHVFGGMEPIGGGTWDFF